MREALDPDNCHVEVELCVKNLLQDDVPALINFLSETLNRNFSDHRIESQGLGKNSSVAIYFIANFPMQYNDERLYKKLVDQGYEVKELNSPYVNN